MKKIKQILSFVFALIAVMTYLFEKPQSTAIVWQANESKNKLEIVLLDEDKECVPFTYLSSATSYQEKIQEMIDGMKVNQTRVEGFSGFLSSDIKVQSVQINQSILEIDFNQAFYSVDPTLEIRILEAMRYLLLQFDEIKGLKITVDKKSFDGFGTYTVSMPIEKGNNLNYFEMMNNQLHKSHSFLVAMIKTQENKSYYTLKTIRSSDSLIENLKTYYCQSNSILLKNGFSLEKFDLKLEEDKMILELGKEILNEHKQCDERLLKSILLTLKSNFKQDQVEIWVEGVLMQEVDLKNIFFNEI